MAMRLVGEGLASSSELPYGELRAQGREHERSVGMTAGEPSSAISRISTLSASIAPTALKHAAVVLQGGGHEPVGVAELGRPPRRSEEGVPERGVAGLALGGAEPDGQIERRGRDRGRRLAA